ncbi:MAG: cytochrome c maturation protein CcmE [Gammaproteobacteria bacterium]|nr:MAG: cytochrome c maturation protein CcmE [Gammaproteobacteria bacterium]
MKPLRKRRLTFVLLITFGLGASIALGLFAMKENINYFYSPKQIVEDNPPLGVLIRLGGLVVEGSVKRDATTLQAKFQLTDNAESVWVSYEGILPDLFREGQGIVTMGKLQSDGSFIASEVLAKHDENYMSPEVADAIKTAEEAAKARVSEGKGS